jgi:hypothetical protein
MRKILDYLIYPILFGCFYLGFETMISFIFKKEKVIDSSDIVSAGVICLIILLMLLFSRKKKGNIDK